MEEKRRSPTSWAVWFGAAVQLIRLFVDLWQAHKL